MKRTIPLMPNDILLCNCHSNEHHLIIRFSEDGDTSSIKSLIKREVFISAHLTTYRNFWKRLKYGLKYAFGYKCKYGAWDETVINVTNYDKLKTIVNFLDNKIDLLTSLEINNT